MAWKRNEIAEAIDRDPITVMTNLSRIKSRGLSDTGRITGRSQTTVNALNRGCASPTLLMS